MIQGEAVNADLDEWYSHVNGVYLDRNFYKSDTVVFAHLSEVVGGLSLLGSEKSKPGVTPTLYVPKALAWWLALCGKVGVKSVSEMVWWKYPGVCPYCLLSVHNDFVCKTGDDTSGPDWLRLRTLADENIDDKPRTLDEWRAMFASIYPPSRQERLSNTFARFSEEMGELAESLRIFPLAPGSFLSEAADVFAWMMHLQNVLLVQGKSGAESLGVCMSNQYASGCSDCRNPVCTCPPILPTTLNRIAHEAPEFRKSFSASMMTIDEAIRKFSLTSRTIAAGDRHVDTSLELIADINKGVNQLIFLAIASKQSSATQAKILMDASYEVANLTAAHQITQQSLDALAAAIAALEPSEREEFLTRLREVNDGLFVNLLSDLVKGAVALLG